MAVQPKIVIAGGGVAGLEALLALRALAGDRVEVTLVAPEPEFVYRPMIVEEAFSLVPAERRDLAALVTELGGRFVLGALAELVPDQHLVRLSDGAELGYDSAIVCVGARAHPAYASATTLRSWEQPVEIDEAIAAAGSHPSRTIAFVVPPGVTWPLPLYELAMFSQRRAAQSGLKLTTLIVTPEPEPLAIFGPPATDAVAEMLGAKGIELRCGASLVERDGGFVTLPDDEALDVGAVVALPVLSGPAVAGLPCDEHGFTPIDDYCRVRGLEDVFAAGDGTDFPINQGGVGTQQADTAAEVIASRAGADVEAQPFRPVLRGKLITESESLSLSSEIAGGSGASEASADALWWPPQKIGGRYLAPFLDGTTARFQTSAPHRPLDVEVSTPKEGHGQPMALDPL